MRAVPRICEFYPGICLTTEKKAWRNLSQGSRRVLAYILPKHTRCKTRTYTHPHITKHFKTTAVQVKTKHSTRYTQMKYSQYTSMPEQVKRPNPWGKMMTRIIKYPQYKVKYPQYKDNCTFIHKNFTATYFTSLTHFTNFTSLHFTRCHWRLDQFLVYHHYRHN